MKERKKRKEKKKESLCKRYVKNKLGKKEI
jgi:hypothetical protein